MTNGFARAFIRLAAAAALVAALAPAAPALAHDMLEVAEPANGSVVATVPPTIRLSFLHAPAALGSRILVTDETGTNQSVGPVVVVDNHVTQAVSPNAPAGRYKVAWRIVSTDSHPMEGIYSFTAGAGGLNEQAATAFVPASPEPAPKPGGAVQPQWSLAAGGAVLAAGLAGTALHVRRRLSVNDADGPVS